jgi:hypothetical protein
MGSSYNIVTDPLVFRYFGRFGSYPAMDALDGIECDKQFHNWGRATFSADIAKCDVAVIPIDRSNALWWGKPENKLVLLWQLGMPVLTTATPVYDRVMAAAGLDMSCSTVAEWGSQLERTISASPDELGRIGQRCRDYALKCYSKDEFLKRFDDAFASIGLDNG